MKENEISIIVPVYNVEKYIGECLYSIINQTDQKFELIIIIDGSIDKSESIARSILENRPNTRIISRKNKGLLASRLEGVQYANGEFVMFVDSDDWLELNAVETLKKYINSDVDIIKASFFRVRDDNEKVKNIYSNEEICKCENSENVLNKFLETYNYNNIFAELIRKELYKDIDIDDTISFGEDLIVNLYLFNNSKKSIIIDDCIYNYRCNQNSITNKLSENRLISNLNDAQKSYEYLVEYSKKTSNSKNIKKAYSRKLQEVNLILLKFAYIYDLDMKKIKLIYKEYFNNKDMQDIRKNIKVIDLAINKCSYILFAALLLLNNLNIYCLLINMLRKIGEKYDKYKKRTKKSIS